MIEDWLYNFDASITICDTEGTVVYMNNKSSSSAYASYGGEKLIGQNILGCHPEPARTKTADMLKNQATNCYTIEKEGVKKLLYQAPWYKKSGEFGGLVEFSFELPFNMPHYIRKP